MWVSETLLCIMWQPQYSCYLNLPKGVNRYSLPTFFLFVHLTYFPRLNGKKQKKKKNVRKFSKYDPMAWSDAHKLIQQKKFVYIHAAKKN